MRIDDLQLVVVLGLSHLHSAACLMGLLLLLTHLVVLGSSREQRCRIRSHAVALEDQIIMYCEGILTDPPDPGDSPPSL